MASPAHDVAQAEGLGRDAVETSAELPRLPATLPPEVHWLFWDFEVEAVDWSQRYRVVAARILERGRIADVRWLLEFGGLDAVRRFFRHHGHVEVSPKTEQSWRLLLNAEGEPWKQSRKSRHSSSSPWSKLAL